MISSQYFIITGTASVFASSRHIGNKQQCSVFTQSTLDDTWTNINYNDFDLVNNSIVLNTPVISSLIKKIELRVADSQEELGTPVTDISIVSGSIDDIQIIADNIDSINIVGSNIDSLNDIAPNIVKATVVADNIVNVNTVADNIVKVNDVSSNMLKVSTVYSNLSNVNTVSGSIANVNTVGSNIANVNTVAGNNTNINTVVSTVVPNMAEILLADNNAATATTKASEASTSASEALAYKNTAQGYMTTTEGYKTTTSGYMTTTEGYKNAASTSASNASTSEANALTYKNAASGYADTATTQASNALTSANNADTSEANALSYSNTAGTYATTATTQAGIATTQANLAISSYDSFDDRYLGAKTTDPTLDNDGNALLTGALYWNTTSNNMRVWNSTAWIVFNNNAASIVSTAFNGISSTNVQAALEELGLEKSNIASPALTGTPTVPTASVTTSTTQIASTAFATPRTDITGASVIPAGTTAQRPASPSNGYLRYNTELLSMEGYINGAWGSVGGGATGGGTNKVFFENDLIVSSNYTITSGKSAVSAGDITINSGITVTVPSGSRWSIV